VSIIPSLDVKDGKLEHLCEVVTIGEASAILACPISHFGEMSIQEDKISGKNQSI